MLGQTKMVGFVGYIDFSSYLCNTEDEKSN